MPGRWAGELPSGKDSKSAAGTLVKRATRYILLLHSPAGRNASLAGVRGTEGDHHPDRIRDQGNETAYRSGWLIAESARTRAWPQTRVGCSALYRTHIWSSSGPV